MKVTILIATLALIGPLACNEDNFAGSGGSVIGKKKSSNQGGQQGPFNPQGGPYTGAGPNNGGLTQTTGQNDSTKCWFMVSGGYFGFPGNRSDNLYNSTFPRPSSGGPIGHGEMFDTVGGVFLNPSDQAYEVGMGGREIDAAFQNTFDSIAVSPGVEYEVRANGAVIASGQGPYIAFSSDHSESFDNPINNIRQREMEMAPWMRNHLSSLGYNIPSIPMHAANYVRVTKIPNTSCD